MGRLLDFLLRRKKAPPPPVIDTEWGPVTESARLLAAINMKADPRIKYRVEQLLAKQRFGGDESKGVAESKRRYPEAYQ